MSVTHLSGPFRADMQLPFTTVQPEQKRALAVYVVGGTNFGIYILQMLESVTCPRVMDSKKLPLWLTFKNQKTNTDVRLLSLCSTLGMVYIAYLLC